MQRLVVALLVAGGRCWTTGGDGWHTAVGKSCWSIGGVALGTADERLDLAACKARCSELFGCNAVLHDAASRQCSLSRQPSLPDCHTGVWPSFASLWRPLDPCADAGGDCGSRAAPGKCVIDTSLVSQCRSTCGTCASSSAPLVSWNWLTSGAGCAFELAESECKAVAAQLGVAWSASPDASGASCVEDRVAGRVSYAALPSGACSTLQRCICRDDRLPFDPASPAVSYVDREGCGIRGPYGAACGGRHIAKEVKSVGFDGTAVATIGGCEYYAYSVHECTDEAGAAPVKRIPLRVVAPQAAPDAAPTTLAPTTTATTTVAPAVGVISGELLLFVSDPEAFVGDTAVKSACASAIAKAAGARDEDVAVRLERMQARRQRRLGLRSVAGGFSATRRLKAAAENKARLEYWVRFADADAEPSKSSTSAVATLEDARKMQGLLEREVTAATHGGLALQVESAPAPRVELGGAALREFERQETAGAPPVLVLVLVAVAAAVAGAVVVVCLRRQSAKTSRSSTVVAAAEEEALASAAPDDAADEAYAEEAVWAAAGVADDAAEVAEAVEAPEAPVEDASLRRTGTSASLFRRLNSAWSSMTARRAPKAQEAADEEHVREPLMAGVEDPDAQAYEGAHEQPYEGGAYTAAEQPYEWGEHAAAEQPYEGYGGDWAPGPDAEPEHGAHPAAEAPAQEALPPAQAEAVETLCAMGFDRAVALPALQRAGWNLEAATEALMAPEEAGAGSGSSPSGAVPMAPAEGPRLTEQQEHDVQTLRDVMDLPRDPVVEALKRCRWNQAEAMEWLFANPPGAALAETPPADAPLSPALGLSPDKVAKVMHITNLGFSREQALQQLETDDWDLQRATNHLIDGG